MNLTALRARTPDIGPLTAVAGALALVAPLEHAAGRALGLGDAHAWTVTITVEGAAGAALLAGRRVAAALALTGCSVLLGALWSAQHDTPLTGPRDPRALLAVGVTALVVSALALAHVVRAAVLAGRADRDAAARAAAEETAAAEHARAVQLAVLGDERERERRAGEQVERDAYRRHVAELSRARAFDEQEQARIALAAEQTRARAAAEQAAAEQARAAAARDRAAAEHARAARERLQEQAEQRQAVAEQRRAAAEQTRAQAEREQAATEQMLADYLGRVRADRDYARREWIEHQWDAPRLAELLDVSESRARALTAEWRRLHAVEAPG